jgi:hypothetical protein
MRLVFAVSFAFACSLFAACGGGGSDNPDAAPPDAETPPDADLCNQDYCEADQSCSDHQSDELHCGDCDTACEGGTYCDSGGCVCPPPFVPANPTLGITQIQNQTIWIGFGIYSDAGATNALVGGIFGTEQTGMDYTLQGANVPFLAAGYGVMLSGQTPSFDAAVVATAGTVNYSEICIDAGTGDVTGFTGTATNVTFSAVDSIQNPVPIKGGCTFDVASVTFTFGDTCPP